MLLAKKTVRIKLTNFEMKLEIGTSNSIALTGPFNTQVELNTQNLIHFGYERVQSSVLATIEKLDKANNWFISSDNIRSNKLTFDVDNYQGLSLTPKYFIGVTIPVTDEISSEISKVSKSITPTIELSIDTITLKFYDFAVGSLIIKGSYKLLEEIDHHDLKEFHENLSSSIPPILNGIIRTANDLFNESLPREFVISENETEPRIAWLHRLYHIDCKLAKNNFVHECMQDVIPQYNEGTIKNSSILSDVEFYPSIGSSLTLARTEYAKQNKQYNSLERAIEFLNCCWHAASRIDKELFYHINELGRNNEKLKLKELEQRYESIHEIGKRITLFKSIYFNHKINLSPQEYILWETISSAWKLDDLTQAITNKLEVLKTMNQSILERVESKQNNKLNYLVFIFTIISFITIFLQIIDFVQQGLNFPNLVRSITVISLTIIILFSVRKLRGWLFGS